ncbi:MAG: hypothetical protein LUD48_00295 [Prevotella sp.]|nr:hypothetical protein [Prevotella sp.]
MNEDECLLTIKNKDNYKQDYVLKFLSPAKYYYHRYDSINDVKKELTKDFPKASKSELSMIKKLTTFPDDKWALQYKGTLMQENNVVIKNKGTNICVTSWLMPKVTA